MKHILIVEFDKEIALALNAKLSNAGYMVSHAYDVCTARQQLKNYVFDFLVLDVTLPAGNGFDVATFSQQKCTKNDTPFIIITSHPSKAYQERSKRLGAADYFEKPYDTNEVQKLIDQSFDKM